ncbi:MAG: hypothetical protein RBT68_08940 [Spirochaetia bacterium]|jgi:hypothetical protein|nr:hypothetical protein [Spirochaetia bacterium]
MKKAIALLLALALVGGAVFAEGLEISGYVNAGMMIQSDADATTYKLYADDWGGDSTFGYMDVSYSNEMSGASVTFIGDSNGAVTVDTAYGWVSPMAGLKLIGGNWSGGAFDGVDDDSNDYFGAEGVFATYSVSGFTAGAGQVLTDSAKKNPDYVFGAAYAIDGMLKIRSSFRTVSDELNKMAISASYTGTPDLLISGGYLAENMLEAPVIDDDLGPIADSDVVNNWIDATVKYTMGDLYAQAIMYYYLAQEWFYVAPRVGYSVNEALSVYGQVKYESEGAGDTDTDFGYNPSTVVLRGYASYKIDDNAQMFGQVEYDTDAEATTFFLNYLWSF